MARNWYGARRIGKEDMYTKKVYTYSDIRWEYIKGFLWLLLGAAYFWFIILGRTI